jgi:hypothetical protein
MSLPTVILLSLSFVFLVIGVHQTVTVGVGHGYWSIMLSVMFFFILAYRKWAAKK